MIRKKLLIGFIILIVVLLVVIDLSTETTLDIKKFNASKEEHFVNITPEELSKYPALEKAIDCANNNTEVESWCWVSWDDWKKIRNFTLSKSHDGDVSSCIKFGEKYGETCYQFIFIKRD